MTKATLWVEIEVPETDDKCWTDDGEQAFYDSVLLPAHYEISRKLGLLSEQAPMELRIRLETKLKVIESVKVDGALMFDKTLD